MPIYEYKCQDCGTKFEKLVRRAGGPEPECPACGQKHIEQQLSTFAAHSGSASRAPEAPACPSGGRCSNPGMCGMNFN
ncbi:MAG: zinc ribbon domain-containing protein [Bryobacteraceae bacterium]|jgi:putative FmdB family regulatory protein